MDNVKKILLTGGGTGGSVTPLLAIAEELPDKQFLFIGTKTGPEKQMVFELAKENIKIKFKPIVSGKLRRYFSLQNFIDLFLIKIGFIQSFFILLSERPNLIISSGSFVGVPIIWAGWILRIPILIHQQDVRPGLANKISAPFARKITVAFEKSLLDYGAKAIWIGNPVRKNFKFFPPQRDPAKAVAIFPAAAGPRQGGGNFQLNKIFEKFRLGKNIPVILVTGGGTGATAINELVAKSLEELLQFCQIIHTTGKNKKFNTSLANFHYKQFEFLNSEQMAEAYLISDIVISRAGMGTLTELSYFGKPSIIIPIPDSHQEENAGVFKNNDAAVVLSQKELTSGKFIKEIKNLLNDEIIKKRLSENIKKVIKNNANEEIIKIIKSID